MDPKIHDDSNRTLLEFIWVPIIKKIDKYNKN